MHLGTTFAADDWRSGNPAFRGNAFSRNLEVVDQLKRFAAEQLSCSVSQLAVAWTLANPAVNVAIVGARHHGVDLVDAPVSGSDGPAREAKLIVLASGPDDARPRVQAIFDAIGRETLWLGPTGQGTRMKLVLNNWLVAQVEAVAETVALTEALGLDPRLFPQAIDDAPLGSPYAVAKARAMISGDYSPGFALRLAFKDAGLALDAAQEVGLSLPLTAALSPRWQQAIADGHADDDVSSVFLESAPGAGSGVTASANSRG
jgi:3-hydroxyisobutyrate dehydrogenase